MGTHSSISANSSAIKEVLKDIDSEIMKVHSKMDLNEGQIKVIEKKVNREIMTSIDSFEKQMLQFSNIAKSINDKFKTTADRVARIEKQLNDFLDTSGSLKNFEEENSNNPQQYSGSGLPSNIDVSQFATTQGLQDFKSTVYKQILKLSVELDDKYVKIEEYKNNSTAMAKKLDQTHVKLKKISLDFESKMKDLEWKVDEKLSTKDFKT